MSNQREVTIFFTQTSKKEIITTDATTWGALKSSIQGGIGDKTCVLSKSKHILGMDSAELPADKFTVFVYPKESKGGMTKKKVKKVVKKTATKKSVKKVVKKVASKKKTKPTKKASKKKVSVPVKEAIGSLVNSISSAEQKKIDNEAALERESIEIQRQLKGYR